MRLSLARALSRELASLVKGTALAMSVLACSKSEPTSPAPAPIGTAPVVVSATPSAPPVASVGPVASKPVLATEGCGAVLPIRLRSAKSIGHTSVVFKLELESNQKLAWKPSSKRGRERWRGEVAASKLGDALAIPNVPPACLRSFTVAELTPLLPKGALDEVIANGDGTITGAVIPWIEGLQFMALDQEPLKSQSKEWLTGDAGRSIPDDKASLAAQLSTLVVFDAITGNWDRYSGGNIGLDGTGKRVLFIDNDAAFMEGAPAKDLAANLARLQATDRFSRSLVTRLRTLDATKAFGTLPGGAPLLSEAVQKLITERIANVLKVVDAKIAARSESDVLYFP